MQKETVTFDKLPEAVGYLTEQVIELKRMVSELQPPASDKHVLVEIEDACRIIRKAKPTIYTLVRKGLLPAYKKGKKLYFQEEPRRKPERFGSLLQGVHATLRLQIPLYRR